jgi:5-methylcytosine-specific restriction endonuclease McrA
MYQLIIPCTRSNTAGRGSSKRRKAKLFGIREVMPCVFCETILSFEEATVEHIVPVSRGGPNVMENLTISCAMCNNNRSSRPFEEWKRMAKFDKMVRLLMKRDRIVGNCLV